METRNIAGEGVAQGKVMGYVEWIKNGDVRCHRGAMEQGQIVGVLALKNTNVRHHRGARDVLWGKEGGSLGEIWHVSM